MSYLLETGCLRTLKARRTFSVVLPAWLDDVVLVSSGKPGIVAGNTAPVESQSLVFLHVTAKEFALSLRTPAMVCHPPVSPSS